MLLMPAVRAVGDRHTASAGLFFGFINSSSVQHQPYVMSGLKVPVSRHVDAGLVASVRRGIVRFSMVAGKGAQF